MKVKDLIASLRSENGQGDYTRAHEMEEDQETVESLMKKIQRWRRAKKRDGTSAERKHRPKAR